MRHEWPSGKRWEIHGNTQAPYLARQLSVFGPRGVTPTSEFICVLPFLDGDARMTQRFILVRAREGPTSNRGKTLYYLAPKCLYRGEYKWMWLRVLSPSRWWCVGRILRVVCWISLVYVVLSVPFYSSKGRPRLQGVGIRISLDIGTTR